MQPVMMFAMLKTATRTNASSFKAKRCICPCVFHMFILIKFYRVHVFISLFLFFLQPEKERKSRTDQEGAE